MFEKSCRCGKSKKNFKMDIGPFYVDDCCIEAGYDESGKKKLDMKDLPSKEEIESQASKLTPDLSPEPEDPPELPDAPEKKKRSYNKGGNIKKQEESKKEE